MTLAITIAISDIVGYVKNYTAKMGVKADNMGLAARIEDEKFIGDHVREGLAYVQRLCDKYSQSSITLDAAQTAYTLTLTMPANWNSNDLVKHSATEIVTWHVIRRWCELTDNNRIGTAEAAMKSGSDSLKLGLSLRKKPTR